MMHAVIARRRYLIPLIVAVACFLVAPHVPPVAMFVLVMVALGLVMDAATSLWARASRTGSMHDYRQ
jgi:hypothetical protein